MSWVVVPVLDRFRDELNEIAPNRDRTSDGAIGDTSHAASASSHNPDRTGSPEWRDGDKHDEVRARDFDKDLGVPGLSMEQVVQHVIQQCRSGEIWWLEYVIYNGRIWTRSGGWATQRYYGSNPHDKHMHLNSRYSQRADEFKGADYKLRELIDLMAGMTEKDLRRIIREEATTVVRKETAGAVWAADRIPNASWRHDAKTNKHVTADYALGRIMEFVGAEIMPAVREVRATLVALTQAQAGVPAAEILAAAQANAARLSELVELVAALAERVDDPAALTRIAAAIEQIASAPAGTLG